MVVRRHTQGGNGRGHPKRYPLGPARGCPTVRLLPLSAHTRPSQGLQGAMGQMCFRGRGRCWKGPRPGPRGWLAPSLGGCDVPQRRCRVRSASIRRELQHCCCESGSTKCIKSGISNRTTRDPRLRTDRWRQRLAGTHLPFCWELRYPPTQGVRRRQRTGLPRVRAGSTYIFRDKRASCWQPSLQRPSKTPDTLRGQEKAGH